MSRPYQTRRGLRLYGAAFLTPVRGLGDVSAGGWLVAAGGGIAAVLRADVIVPGVIIAILAGLVDYTLGYARARIERRDRADVAYAGLLAKVGGIALILLVRGLEAWLQSSIPGWPDTGGLVAGVICTAVIVGELNSINRHGLRLPVVTAVLQWIDDTVSRRLPSPPPVAPLAAPDAESPGGQP